MQFLQRIRSLVQSVGNHYANEMRSKILDSRKLDLDCRKKRMFIDRISSSNKVNHKKHLYLYYVSFTQVESVGGKDSQLFSGEDCGIYGSTKD